MGFGWLYIECECPQPEPAGWFFIPCECCVEPEPLPPPPVIRSIPKIDKQFYRVAMSKCDIQANTKFGNAYYQQVKQLKYGIEAPCPVDFDKIWIKKRLSDLAMLKDPTLCVPVTPLCPDPCAPEPVECTYPTPTPVSCDSVTSVSTKASY